MEDEITQRVYRTSAGLIDWSQASEAAQAFSTGRATPGDHRVLSALFNRALPGAKTVQTDAGVMSALQAAQLLTRLRRKVTTGDCHALWSVLFALFDK